MASVSEERANPFAFADEILSYSDRLWKTLVYFSVFSVYLVGAVIWLLLGQPSSFEWNAVIAGFGFVFAIYFPFAVWNAFRLIRPLRRWMDDYFDFAFVVKFELFPPKGATPTERILNKLGEVYPEVARLTEKGSKAIRLNSGITEKSRMRWECVIDLKYPRILRISWIHRHVGTPDYLLVKRFDREAAVGVSDLRELEKALRRDLRWQNWTVTRLFVVAPGGFTEDAIEAVKDETIKGLLDEILELVVETEHGYELPVKD